MLLCVTYIDSDGKFRDELMEIFDVSEEGATAGAALEDRVSKFLRTLHLSMVLRMYATIPPGVTLLATQRCKRNALRRVYKKC
jgi:hypothetical protein